MAPPVTQPKIFAIPSELIEETLVVAAACGFPAAIAAFGRTCRYFHHLVYRSADHHLWREVFLTTFDDPRPILKRMRDVTTHLGPMPRDLDVHIDWAEEFMTRMGAARTFREYVGITNGTIDMFSTQETKGQQFTQALETIIHVLELSAPFPSHRTELTSSESPTFPPIVVMQASLSLPPEVASRSIAWVDEILTHGYPPALVKKYLLAGHQPSKPLEAAEDTLWRYPEEGQLFHKLIFLKGFVPVPGDVGHVTRRSRQIILEQKIAARKVARSKVYNLRYLRPERSWGPFIPAGNTPCSSTSKSNTASNTSSFLDFEQEPSRYALNVENLIAEEASDSEDEDFVPDEEADDDDELDDPEVEIVLNSRRRVDPNFVGPKPHQVVPDYTFLAAVRLLIEQNLRDTSTMDGTDQMVNGQTIRVSMQAIIDALGCLDFVRMGGAPAFWEKSWAKPEDIVEPNGPSIDNGRGSMMWDHRRKGKINVIKEYEEVEGWDWAGVTGQWIRVISWLDYRDLLVHNHDLHRHSSNIDFEETVHFFPLTLRVAGYSKPPEPDPSEIISPEDADALVWRLPVIHIEGEARGSDIDTTSQIVRRVRGVVRMLKEGSVRWSLATSYPDEDTAEWATEAVQIGSIGSAVGLLGMWTGAEHARTDPLGPAWAWKIA